MIKLFDDKDKLRPDNDSDKWRGDRRNDNLGDERIRGGSKPDKSGGMHDDDDKSEDPMSDGSQHDRTRHPGSRSVTEGTTGGTGAEVGGTRNYRQGTGATGTDIGNRPE